MKRFVFPMVLAMSTALSACSSDPAETPSGPSDDDKKAVLVAYANLVRANYDDSLAGMRTLKTAIDAFVAEPSEATLAAARKAWIEARPSYGQSEVFRFYGGPIDDEETGPEGRINGWPLDENFIDYTEAEPTAGIINATEQFPQITKELIAEQNENGGEKNLSAGWHAIEFLLWGQDLSDAGPGARPFTDYVVGSGAANVERRRDYLVAAVDLMIEDMEGVAAQWNLDDTESYASKFVAAAPDESLAKIVTAIGSLGGSELPKERINNAYETKDQEEEHSCFSDTTNQDILANAQGLENAYLGRYGSVDGPGIDELVRAKDPELDTKMKGRLSAALAACAAIPAPFDQAILGDDSAEGRQKIKAAMDALQEVTDATVEVATVLGLTINLE